MRYTIIKVVDALSLADALKKEAKGTVVKVEEYMEEPSPTIMGFSR